MSMSNRLELPLRQIFNERSLKECLADRSFGHRLTHEFLDVTRKLHDAGFSFGLALSKAVTDRTSEESKWLFEWLFRHPCEEDERERKNVLRRLFTSEAFLEDILPPTSLNEDVILDGVRISNNATVSALVASYYLGVPSSAVCPERGHADGRYRLHVVSPDNVDANGDFVATDAVVRSISCVDQVPAALEAIRVASIRELKTCQDISGTAAKMFPNLEFSTRAVKTLDSRDFTDFGEAFSWFCQMLFEIDYAWSRVQSGECPDFFTAFGKVGYIAEHESPLTEKTYRDQHTFAGGDGARHVCFSHCKNKPLNKRIYFDVPSDRDSRVFVGHIGSHLKTVLYG